MKNLDKLMDVIDILIANEEKYPVNMEHFRAEEDITPEGMIE